MTAGLIQRLRASNWIVATLRAYEWDRFQPADQLRPPEWDVLRLFKLVLLDRDRDRPTDEDLRQAVPDENIRERIARVGIGEYVGAAQHVRDQLTVGESANPLGYALVAGAADWSRVGLTRPVPAELLRRLAEARLTGRRRDELNDDEKYRAGLEWATREINPTVSLLEPADGTYRVYDLALDHLATATDRIVPAATWQLAIDEAAADELASVGYQAMIHDLPDNAAAAWRKAANAGDPSAMCNLGVLLQKRGDTDEAEHWYRQAANTGETVSMYNLGLLLAKQGDADEAEHWYRQAAEAGQPQAMQVLAVLLAERGGTDEAEHWHRQAASAGHHEAMHSLSVLLEARGDINEARYWAAQGEITFAGLLY
ncbi:tetratricopeptide repeat protein [Amycolatopsis sp. NPDC003861]